MTELKTKADCGCEAGYFLCRAAEDLWRKVNDTYHKAQRTHEIGDWNAFDTARLEYGKHMLPLTRINIEDKKIIGIELVS